MKFDIKNAPISSIAIGPYPESANAEETWQRMQFLYQKMEAAGWIVDEERNSKNSASETRTAADLKKKYDPLPSGAGGVQRFWYDNNGLEAWLRLVKTVTGMPVEMESRFNIVIDIQIISTDASKHARLDEKGRFLLPKYDDKDDAGQSDVR